MAPVTGRVIFQRFHVLINRKPDEELLGFKFEANPQYDVLGREFDSKSIEQQNALAQQCRLSLGAFVGFESARIHLDKQAEMVNGLELRGFPGGAKQQVAELKVHKRLNDDLKARLLLLKPHVDLMIRVHHQVGSSQYCLDSVKNLQNQVAQKVGEANRGGQEIDEKIASIGDVGPFIPADQETQRQIEALKHDQLDYFPPLLTSDSRWVFATDIGKSVGLASLWVRLDDHDVVRDRVVRKDTKLTREALYNPRLWVADPEDAKRKLPTEFCCQRRAQWPPEATNIVAARKAEVDEERLVCRLYTAFCPHGDMSGLIEANTADLQKFPEAWVWMVFSALVDCGLIMERGYVKDVPLDDIDWKQIVHRDLKPHNIFLDLAREDTWPRYPQPKVGDFGLAISTWPGDPRNPRYWGGAGTIGWRAPEQTRLAEKPPKGPSIQLLAHTNVWGVGKIISDMVNRTPSVMRAEDPPYLPDGHCDIKWRNEVEKRFSAGLLNTIKDCLRYDPRMRPTFAELRKRIDSFICSPLAEPRESEASVQAYMNDARMGIQPEVDEHRLHCLPDEKYKVDMAFQNLKTRPGHGVPSATPGASWRSDSQ